MPLNKELVGKEYAPTTTEATLEAMQNYARAYNDDNPAFFDASRTGGIVAPPMFAVVMIWSSIMSVVGDPDLKVDVIRLLHGEQDMEFLLPDSAGRQNHRQRESRIDRNQGDRRDLDHRDQRDQSGRRRR